jgi:hypothetical protein
MSGVLPYRAPAKLSDGHVQTIYPLLAFCAD